ncbi:hypothetical protein HK097_004003, partial [Rhizophlyctis rosea]
AEEELIEDLERLAGLVRQIVGQDTFARELFDMEEFQIGYDDDEHYEKRALLNPGGGGGVGSSGFSYGGGSMEEEVEMSVLVDSLSSAVPDDVVRGVRAGSLGGLVSEERGGTPEVVVSVTPATL